MAYSSSLTQKGQVTIPQEIRKHLKLKPLDRVFFVKDKDSVVIKPANSFLNAEGSVKTKIKYSDSLADKHVSGYIHDEYEETSNP